MKKAKGKKPGGRRGEKSRGGRRVSGGRKPCTSKPQSAAAPPAPPRPPGRPTLYRRELAEQILERFAGGESFRTICDDEGMPSRATVYLWLADESHPFSGLAQRARKAAAFALSEEALEIADDSSRDVKTVMRGGQEIEVTDHEVIGRSKLRVDLRRHLAEKYHPGVFGARTFVVDETPRTDDEIRARIEFLMGKAGGKR